MGHGDRDKNIYEYEYVALENTSNGNKVGYSAERDVILGYIFIFIYLSVKEVLYRVSMLIPLLSAMIKSHGWIEMKLHIRMRYAFPTPDETTDFEPLKSNRQHKR